MSVLATSIAFEKRYSDDSGVEFAVRLVGGNVEFEAVTTVSFPPEQIDWLMDCLYRIKRELPERKP